MPKSDTLIRTKLRLPFTRPELVPRPRLQERIAHGLRFPLTLITAPAGFGKTTLMASCVAACGMPAAWLSLDKDDNQVGRFLNYLVAALRAADPTIGSEAAGLLAAPRQASAEVILTSLINDLEAAGGDIALVLDDYQFIGSQAVHEEVAFLLEHCPKTFHLVIASRSDPPLPLTRLRARARMVELRAADLGFTEHEAEQFLNEVMGLGLDAGAVAALEERTEGWIAGLQMAALSMRDREDIPGFVTGFAGTNRYILDYLLEEVLARQSPEIQHFLLYTSILERLTARLCDALTGGQGIEKFALPPPPGLPPIGEMAVSQSILEYLERANLFLVPLDDERTWYRYHHLFADLLRAQLQRSLDGQGVAQLHVRAAEWHAQNGSILEAINHASMAADDERVERFIEQNYMEMVSRGEMAGLRFWTGKLSRELVYRRPWLCIYEAYSHSWFGELDEADRLLEEAERRVRSEVSAPDAHAMLGHLDYVKSRVTAMRGDVEQAIELCLAAREHIPAGNLALESDTRITLGYEYFLNGDFAHASPILDDTIQSGLAAGAVINTVAASCVLARLYSIQGHLHNSYDTYQNAARSIPDERGQHLGARALVEVGIADVRYERNELDAALAHVQQGLALLPLWGNADDLALAYVTLARIHLAQADGSAAREAVEKALHVIRTNGVFPEARATVEVAQVKLWLAQDDLLSANRWAASRADRLGSDDPFQFHDEPAHIARARILIAQHRPDEAVKLLSQLETPARSAGRMGRLIEILLLEAMALQQIGDSRHAILALTDCLTLAEPEGYMRVFLDEGQPVRNLLGQWLAHASAGSLHTYALALLSGFDAEPHLVPAARREAAPTGSNLVEPLSQRELEVLQLIALGLINRDIARQLVVAQGTVKAHTASIYRKLDVSNRTEAVARARQLGLLP